MRITNSMMTANTKSNININKFNADKLNTMTASGQKIERPSDDPVIAIRAMRLNTSLTELEQYHGKNIPDADAWFTDTETALMQADDVITSIREKLNQATSEENVTSNVEDILEELKQLKTQFYALGNTDTAGRTVFTGYRTGEMLTFTEADTIKYEITENVDIKSLESISYIKGKKDVNMSTDDTLSDYKETTVTSEDINRIRLSYDNLEDMKDDPPSISFRKVVYELNADGTEDKTKPVKETDPETSKESVKIENKTIATETKSIAGLTQQEIDDIYTELRDSDEEKAYYIPETGEIILSKKAYETLKDAMTDSLNDSDNFQIMYEKKEWKKGDLRPEHYFMCRTPKDTEKNDPRTYSSTYPDGIEYNYNRINEKTKEPLTSGGKIQGFIEQELTYEIAYNQSMQINTHASDVFSHNIGRDIDELINITKLMSDANKKVDILKSKLADETDETKKKNYTDLVAAAEKEQTLIKEKMHDMFKSAITSFKGYSDDVNKQLSAVGALTSRLEMTKNRVKDQQTNVKKLADENINADLTETAIDYKNAQLALEAAQMAAGKIANQTLLNYI